MYIVIEKSVAVSQLNVFKKNYPKLIDMLFITNLTPHLIQEKIITPVDQEILVTLPTNHDKADFVLAKISFALRNGLTGSFYKMLEIMKFYGNRDVKRLATDIEFEGTYMYMYVCFV